MITANELRIGNWIMFDNRYFQIECNSVHFPYLRTAEFGAGVVEYRNIFGIPLTEEILLKCGFEKEKKPYISTQNGLHTKVHCYKLPSDNFEYLGKFTWGFMLIDLDIPNMENKPIQHLHELQNLYYALTKTELIINL